MARKTHLTPEDHRRVIAAVSAAEAASSGEIVTVLADRSDGYTDVALAWSISAAFAALIALAIAPGFYLALYERLTGGWGSAWSPRQLFELAAGFAALKFGGMLLLQMWQPLRFWLVPPPIKTARVHECAVRAFRIGAERRTHGRTGVLIYLSMREHRAEILADESIAAKVPAEFWGEAMLAMLREVREGRVAEGMVVAVEQVGAVLAEHFPAGSGNPNELPDWLIEV
jgi:putative membrane protein